MSEYIDEYQNPDADPLDSRSQDFDWEELYRRCDEASERLNESEYEKLPQAFGSLLNWALQWRGWKPVSHNNRLSIEERIGRRFVALCWVIDPGLFDGASLTKVAKQLGLHKVKLSVHAADASRKFGISNRGQRHAHNFQREKPPDA